MASPAATIGNPASALPKALEAPLLEGAEQQQQQQTSWRSLGRTLALVGASVSLALLLVTGTPRFAEDGLALRGAGGEPAPVTTPAAALEAEAGAPWQSPPPLFRIVASSPYDAGLQHGRLAKEKILGWFNTTEMQGVFAYVDGEGREIFEQLKEENAAEYPEFVEELRGIAHGAGVSLDMVWCANLLNELENMRDIQGQQKAGLHCSDIFAVASGGYKNGFALGHNDDWNDGVKPFWYLVAVTYTGSAPASLGFDRCAGVAYPAALVGWAPTWNGHGIFSTQNSMVPTRQRTGGLACAFVQRRAICSAHNLDEAVSALTVPGWSDGASMNVFDLRGGRMANVELWEDRHSVTEVTEEMGNYSHFNEYKHLSLARGGSIDDPRIFARDFRQARADELPPPRSTVDVMATLSDAKIFRPTATITTFVVNSTGIMRVWCAAPSINTPPAYTWDLYDFF